MSEKNFVYYRVSFRLKTPMLGTATEASIWKQHILERAKKEIAKLNRVTKKLSAAAAKYAGTEITHEKEIEEIKSCIRATEEALGKKGDLPAEPLALVEYATQLAEEFGEAIKAGEATKATVFMRDENGWPRISTHMILGNLKENLKIMVNNTATATKEDKVYKSKAAVQEVLALDVKAIEMFMKPSENISRKEDGTPLWDERPIRFTDGFGNTVTAISLSEQLPEGTEFETVLRVRAGSMVEPLLPKLLDMGKSNGLGAWRGSGNRGAYFFKLEKLENYVEKKPEGWN